MNKRLRVEDILHSDLIDIIIDYHQDIKTNKQEVIKELKYKFKDSKLNYSWNYAIDNYHNKESYIAFYFTNHFVSYKAEYIGFKYLFNRINYKAQYSGSDSESWKSNYDYNLRDRLNDFNSSDDE